ncbi:MAG: glycoside hydrolase family 20 zincin-like fold domain-containing protein, partial [Acidobacteriaceae bacterium]
MKSRFAPLLLLCCAAAVPSTAIADSTRPPLIPQPREFTSRPDIALSAGLRIVVPGGDAADRFAAEDLQKGLEARGVRVRDSASAVRIYLLRDDTPLARRLMRRDRMPLDAAMQPEGYVLITERHEAFVIGHTAAGVFYG